MLSDARAALIKIKRRFCQSEWPRPSHKLALDREPKFVFIFTPPYSGSTALAKVLNSAWSSMALTSDCEGQWLVPGLCKSDRWDPGKWVDWESVRLTWLSKVRMVEELTGKARIVIEKSPPNLVRHNELLATFPNHEIIVFNRNPFANCSSILYRNYPAEDMSDNDRLEILENLAKKWINRSSYAMKVSSLHSSLTITYEQFCADSSGIVKMLIDRIPSLQGIDPDLEIRVKDYPAQKITNFNNVQISKLTPREIEMIGIVLSKHEALLNQFQYTSDWRKDIKEGGASSRTSA
jgi:hypothetical protein